MKVNLDFEVVVIGGGPAGAIAAKYAAQNGVNTLILEQKKTIGYWPYSCFGLPFSLF